MKEITVQELNRRMKEGEMANVLLLDVREPHERAAGNIGGMHVPMGSVSDQLAELDKWKAKEIIVYCRSGGRSNSVGDFLNKLGYQNVKNLRGGMLAWKDSIDPTFVV